MKRIEALLFTSLFLFLAAGTAFGDETTKFPEEIAAPKVQIEHLVEKSDKQPIATSNGDEARWYEEIEISVGMTIVLQSSIGGEEESNQKGNVTDCSVSFDLEMSKPIFESGMVFSLLQAGQGNGVDGDFTSFSGFNSDADNDNNIRLSELWYEHGWRDMTIRFRIGKINITACFDGNRVANSETEQFLSGGFVNNLSVEFPDDNSFGMMLWMTFSDSYELGVGYMDADADWDNAFDDSFLIAQLNLMPDFAGRQGNYRVYGWINNKDHEDLEDTSKASEKNYGYGLSFDQEISDSVILFARYGHQRASVSQIEHAWSIGFQCSGCIFGRDDDSFGFAFGSTILSTTWEAISRAKGVNTSNESHVEMYYNLWINEYLSISPDIQFVKDINGNGDSENVWLLGIRMQMSF